MGIDDITVWFLFLTALLGIVFMGLAIYVTVTDIQVQGWGDSYGGEIKKARMEGFREGFESARHIFFTREDEYPKLLEDHFQECKIGEDMLLVEETHENEAFSSRWPLIRYCGYYLMEVEEDRIAYRHLYVTYTTFT